MQQPELVKIKICTQGEIFVNAGYEEPCELKMLYIDLEQKRADTISMGATVDGIPELMLYADEETLGVDKNKGLGTVIQFPEYKGWEVLNCWVGRYTLTVILKKSK